MRDLEELRPDRAARLRFKAEQAGLTVDQYRRRRRIAAKKVFTGLASAALKAVTGKIKGKV